MNEIKEKTIVEIVANDYRTAAVFELFGIDFCCKGNRTIDEACEAKHINVNDVKEKLARMTNLQQSITTDYNSWAIDLLADYIQQKHHSYIQEKTPVLKEYLEKLCKVHGDRYPELFEITEEFNESVGELAMHMKKEELVLFPLIRKMVAAQRTKQLWSQPHFETVKNPIQIMLQEHDLEGDRFKKISKLSNSYLPPADSCNTYRVTYALLKQFEDDLHLHIHLENNILFPKSIELEKTISE